MISEVSISGVRSSAPGGVAARPGGPVAGRREAQPPHLPRADRGLRAGRAVALGPPAHGGEHKAYNVRFNVIITRALTILYYIIRLYGY